MALYESYLFQKNDVALAAFAVLTGALPIPFVLCFIFSVILRGCLILWNFVVSYFLCYLKRMPYTLNSRAGFPFGAAEIFSLMQHMGCEPDRASYNILVDAYGRAGFLDGIYLSSKVVILFCSFTCSVVASNGLFYFLTFLNGWYRSWSCFWKHEKSRNNTNNEIPHGTFVCLFQNWQWVNVKIFSTKCANLAWN